MLKVVFVALTCNDNAIMSLSLRILLTLWAVILFWEDRIIRLVVGCTQHLKMATVLIIGSLLYICISQTGVYVNRLPVFCNFRWPFVCRIWRLERLCKTKGRQNKFRFQCLSKNSRPIIVWKRCTTVHFHSLLKVHWPARSRNSKHRWTSLRL